MRGAQSVAFPFRFPAPLQSAGTGIGKCGRPAAVPLKCPARWSIKLRDHAQVNGRKGTGLFVKLLNKLKMTRPTVMEAQRIGEALSVRDFQRAVARSWAGAGPRPR
jgi:hypothetical protein